MKSSLITEDNFTKVITDLNIKISDQEKKTLIRYAHTLSNTGAEYSCDNNIN